MSNQSITNKLVANIRQASDVSKNFFTDTNRVVCIDTSNTRIGINTKTPQWSIDISGTGSYNGVKCHNLDISGKADISYAVIKDLRAPIISGDDVNISFIYVNELSGNLIDISEVLFNSISGDFIYSKECTIESSANIKYLEISSGFVYGNMEVSGLLTAPQLDLGSGLQNFGSVTISNEFTIKSNADVSFNCDRPVKYKELSGNHINTLSLSCENLQVNQQADFSSINVLGEASFNTIHVSGEASFNTINAKQIIQNGDTLDTIITNNTAHRYSNGDEDVDFNRLQGTKIFITQDPNNNPIPTEIAGSGFLDTINHIDSLRLTKNLEIANQGYLKLSDANEIIINEADKLYNGVEYLENDLSGVICYNTDNTGAINGLVLFTSGSDHTSNRITLKDNKTNFLMFENSNNNLIKHDLYDYIDIKRNNNGTNVITNNDYVISSGDPIGTNLNFIGIDNSVFNDRSKNIEININLSLQLINDVPGRDVDAANYTLYLLSYYTTTGIYPTFNTLNKIKNSILVLDNSYNYANSSLNYIGKLNTSNNSNDVSGIYFGLSFEHVSDLSFQVESFSGYIKTLV